jgi:hypothetical protein
MYEYLLGRLRGDVVKAVFTPTRTGTPDEKYAELISAVIRELLNLRPDASAAEEKLPATRVSDYRGSIAMRIVQAVLDNVEDKGEPKVMRKKAKRKAAKKRKVVRKKATEKKAGRKVKKKTKKEARKKV